MRFAAAILLTSVSLAALGQAAAAETTQTAAQIRVVRYSPLLRTEIVGVIGQPTTITFPPGESVYRVVQTGKPNKDGALADAGWQGASPSEIKDTPLGNNLTLWPVIPGESTMTVITMSSEGAQKVYPFRLLARPDSDGAADMPGVVLNLIFKGGAAPDPAAPAVAARKAAAGRASWRARQKAGQIAQAAAEEHLRTDAFNAANGACHYIAKGRRPNAIEPRCPMDNGQWTLMRFPGLSEKPAVYVVGNDGSERLARQHGAGDFVVVEEIAPHFRLRLGPSVLDILNTAYDPAGKPTGTGTTAPTVERDILQAKAR
ncbi:MAG TPA: TrbG/VirB9 family P-type conjugative transfer protein [Stellaceae bacterium]|nr:TrbG/VirB9 family P-type conjugative transfer protein [Stellaceae bacterium]